jgi:hypothetical protein
MGEACIGLEKLFILVMVVTGTTAAARAVVLAVAGEFRPLPVPTKGWGAKVSWTDAVDTFCGMWGDAAGRRLLRGGVRARTGGSRKRLLVLPDGVLSPMVERRGVLDRSLGRRVADPPAADGGRGKARVRDVERAGVLMLL